MISTLTPPFPKKDDIIAHLSTDERTKDIYRVRKRLVEIIADIFNEHIWIEENLDRDLLIILSDVKVLPLGLSIEALRDRIAPALKDLVRFSAKVSSKPLEVSVSRL